MCRDGGRVVGFACLVGEGEEAALFVAPERQCEGIGTALLDWVKEHSKGMLTVGVYEENARARAFYEQGLGWAPDGWWLPRASRPRSPWRATRAACWTTCCEPCNCTATPACFWRRWSARRPATQPMPSR